MADLMRRPWIDAATYRTLFAVGLPAAYRDAREGRFGAFRVGAQYRFPSSPLREALGLPIVPIAAAPSSSTEPAAEAA